MTKEDFTLVINGKCEPVAILGTHKQHIFSVQFREQHIGYVQRKVKGDHSSKFIATHEETGHFAAGTTRRQAVTTLIYDLYRMANQ